MNTLSPEAERRIGNLTNLGTITAVDYHRGLCRVQIGDNITDWLPFGCGSHGAVRFWNPPSLGEQVCVSSLDGELENAYITHALPTPDHPHAHDSGDRIALDLPDGAQIAYDHSSHRLDITLPAGSHIELSADTIALSATSTLHLSGTLIINGQPYQAHRHTSVQSGPDTSGGVSP